MDNTTKSSTNGGLAKLLADKGRATPVSREELEAANKATMDAFAAGHTVSGATPTVRHDAVAPRDKLPEHGIEKPAFTTGAPYAHASQGDAVQPTSSNNNSEANDIKYVPASVEAPKGSYVALRLHSVIRKSGVKVVPTNGYYVVEDQEMKELLDYYDKQNLGLVQYVN